MDRGLPGRLPPGTSLAGSPGSTEVGTRAVIPPSPAPAVPGGAVPRRRSGPGARPDRTAGCLNRTHHGTFLYGSWWAHPWLFKLHAAFDIGPGAHAGLPLPTVE